eukprot:gnl/TRDRNA2_/TRDRNA2_131150_c0_seq1.p1 gnl/TRDRNA2_/TRDRNA2_131150_c0~~gnl/TRDRNA2_/TRDRNA2_131150_c0_seq1.p1  ORF type:complete len:739 (+),score=81.23 gnl/TRDRNA2_/TRDRNA2_131150_c0_seq1:146-2362(+)
MSADVDSFACPQLLLDEELPAAGIPGSHECIRLDAPLRDAAQHPATPSRGVTTKYFHLASPSSRHSDFTGVPTSAQSSLAKSPSSSWWHCLSGPTPVGGMAEVSPDMSREGIFSFTWSGLDKENMAPQFDENCLCPLSGDCLTCSPSRSDVSHARRQDRPNSSSLCTAMLEVPATAIAHSMQDQPLILPKAVAWDEAREVAREKDAAARDADREANDWEEAWKVASVGKAAALDAVAQNMLAIIKGASSRVRSAEVAVFETEEQTREVAAWDAQIYQAPPWKMDALSCDSATQEAIASETASTGMIEMEDAAIMTAAEKGSEFQQDPGDDARASASTKIEVVPWQAVEKDSVSAQQPARSSDAPSLVPPAVASATENQELPGLMPDGFGYAAERIVPTALGGLATSKAQCASTDPRAEQSSAQHGCGHCEDIESRWIALKAECDGLRMSVSRLETALQLQSHANGDDATGCFEAPPQLSPSAAAESQTTTSMTMNGSRCTEQHHGMHIEPPVAEYQGAPSLSCEPSLECCQAMTVGLHGAAQATSSDCGKDYPASLFGSPLQTRKVSSVRSTPKVADLHHLARIDRGDPHLSLKDRCSRPAPGSAQPTCWPHQSPWQSPSIRVHDGARMDSLDRSLSGAPFLPTATSRSTPLHSPIHRTPEVARMDTSDLSFCAVPFLPTAVSSSAATITGGLVPGGTGTARRYSMLRICENLPRHLMSYAATAESAPSGAAAPGVVR